MHVWIMKRFYIIPMDLCSSSTNRTPDNNLGNTSLQCSYSAQPNWIRWCPWSIGIPLRLFERLETPTKSRMENIGFVWNVQNVSYCNDTRTRAISWTTKITGWLKYKKFRKWASSQLPFEGWHFSVDIRNRSKYIRVIIVYANHLLLKYSQKVLYLNLFE